MCIGIRFTPQAPHGPALAASLQKPNVMGSTYICFESQPHRRPLDPCLVADAPSENTDSHK